jgi:peptide/nickel transport system permease protein
MIRFFASKLARLCALLAVVSAVSFALVSLSPIDPVDAYVGADMLRIGPEQRALIAQRWGLDQPAPARFMLWLGQLAQGNLGTSMIFNEPVITVIMTRFQASLGLMTIAWLASGVLGFALGVVAGVREDSVLDKAIRWYAYALASTPTFWVALLLLLVFSVTLQVTPICCAAPPGKLTAEVTFGERLLHLALPALTLSIVGVANIALHTRQKLIEVSHSDHALFARAQGETRFGWIRAHGLRNIALPALTLQFASISELFGGAVLVERAFAYPGLGGATVEAGLRGDVPLLLGITLFSAVFVFVGNSVADLLYQLVDPRIRAERLRMQPEAA